MNIKINTTERERDSLSYVAVEVFIEGGGEMCVSSWDCNTIDEAREQLPDMLKQALTFQDQCPRR
jgi:hypothetical protein